MVKGGVWKKREDAILKAAVMKYGTNQWVRISSLLARKSAKRCKSRWYERHDPSINKSDWTREEDEKLLHIAKLFPGEIDPNTTVAKPLCPESDPIDMDEDEKDMLSEARARLANTRVGRDRKKKGIEYNAEIPFEKRAPSGSCDTADEDLPAAQVIEEHDGKRMADVEAQLNEQDAPAATLQANRLNDPDNELEEMAKMVYASDLLAEDEVLTGGCAATTPALLGNNSQTPMQVMTPMRTPQSLSVGKADAIMTEAENQTCLLGGENPELHSSGFSGVTPRKKEIQMPNPGLNPLRAPSGSCDTADEDRPADQVTEELDGKRMADVEAQLRKQDVAGNKQDASAAIMTEAEQDVAATLQANKLNDPEACRKGSELMLPPPSQISDEVLEDTAKNGENEVVKGRCAADKGRPAWTDAKHDELMSLWRSGKDIDEVSKRFGISVDSCGVRLRNLGCELKEIEVLVTNEERVFCVQILWPMEKLNPKFLQKIDQIRVEDKVDIEISPCMLDEYFSLISISASEEYNSISRVSASCLKILLTCIQKLGNHKFKRIIAGDCRVQLFTRGLRNFHTSFIIFYDRGYYAKGYVVKTNTYTGLNASVTYDNDRYLIEIKGGWSSVRNAFEEAIRVLKKNFFTRVTYVNKE
ncbi:hypothetical protein AALP_AA6G080400 [Arabis alpina]|uniref:Myb-like domain-containing protein n=1 Tax=Arabis alpina TaxID=50452 RepID=A0A087GMU1_ARAAL|nr:hypothetical protein AALP_AA6G080400 [Arabis alpina]